MRGRGPWPGQGLRPASGGGPSGALAMEPQSSLSWPARVDSKDPGTLIIHHKNEDRGRCLFILSLFSKKPLHQDPFASHLPSLWEQGSQG